MAQLWKGSIQSVNDLENLNAEYFPQYVVIYLANKNKWYYYDSNASNTVDNERVIQASPQGRWIAVNDEGFINYKTSNSEPQSPPQRENELIFFTQSNRMFLSTGVSSTSDWYEIPLKSSKYGSGDPSSTGVAVDYQSQIYIDTSNNFFYISTDGSSWTKVVFDDVNKTTTTVSNSSPSSNPKAVGDRHVDDDNYEEYVALTSTSFKKLPHTIDTHLILDVGNKSNYSSFNDLQDPVDIQVYYAPPFVNLASYDWARYGLSYNTSRDEVAYLVNTVELSSNYDLSSMIKANGIGLYLFLPTYEDSGTYTMCGEASSMNIGLEFVNAPSKGKAKIHNATDGAKGDETIVVNGTTLTGTCQILVVNQTNFDATIQVVPYGNLSDGSLK